MVLGSGSAKRSTPLSWFLPPYPNPIVGLLDFAGLGDLEQDFAHFYNAIQSHLAAAQSTDEADDVGPLRQIVQGGPHLIVQDRAVVGRPKGVVPIDDPDGFGPPERLLDIRRREGAQPAQAHEADLMSLLPA